MERAARLLLLVLLVRCAAAPPPAGPVACDLRAAAEIAVTSERGFVSAPAVIEDKPVTLLIDTGAESSLVTPSAMSSLRLRPDPHRRTTIQGTGGAITTQNAALQSFGIGGMDRLDQSFAVGPLPGGQGADLPDAGLLGADWLRDFEVDFDLPHGRITLYREQGCNGDAVAWTGPRTAVVARVYGRGLLLLPVTLDGQPVIALLDSGANRSVVSEAVAARIGLAAADLAHDPGGQSVGVDGTVRMMRRHRFGVLQVGGIQSVNPVIDISQLHAPGAEMLLGADWLRGHRVWISYAARRVTIQPRGL